MIKKFYYYLTEGIWRIHAEELPKWKELWINFLRTVLLTLQGFTKNQIQLGASSLTYYTLLALVPVIALLIGVARGFLLESDFETWLLNKFSDQREVVYNVFNFAKLSLQQASQGVLAGFGIILLFWATLKILINIEEAMNQIWEVDEGRTLRRRVMDYLALLIFTPLLLFLASGINVYISALVNSLSEEGTILRDIGIILNPILLLVPFVLNCFLWTFLYILVPNTRVHFWPAFIAAVFTAVLYQIFQWIYFRLQIGVSTYNAIYGTFAAFPLFLIWLHLSWVVMLLGAKVAFAIQNVHSYQFLKEKIRLNNKTLLLSSLRITQYCVNRFLLGEPAPMVNEISTALSVPRNIVQHLLHDLTQAKVLSEVKRKDEELGFQPAKNVETLSIKEVMDRLSELGQTLPSPLDPSMASILEVLEKMDEAAEKSGANRLLKEI